jgi:hypothetical protein
VNKFSLKTLVPAECTVMEAAAEVAAVAADVVIDEIFNEKEQRCCVLLRLMTVLI